MYRPVALVLALSTALTSVHSAHAQRLRSAAEVERALQMFTGDRSIRVRRLGRPDFYRHSYRYELGVRRRGPDGRELLDFYTVDAFTGEVTSMLLSLAGPEWQGEPVLSREDCYQRARAFAAAHYAGFERLPVRLEEVTLSGNEDIYHFYWRLVRNRFGATAPVASVGVHRGSGHVVTYTSWRLRITAPTVPRVTRAQAERIAGLFSPRDPAAVPFAKVTLELTVDEVGVQRLVWHLVQEYPTTPDPFTLGGGWKVDIDAITGEVLQTYQSLSGGLPEREPSPGAGVRRRPPPALWLNGQPVDLHLGVLFRRGRAYLPAAVAQLLGWYLEHEPGKRLARLRHLEQAGRHVTLAAPRNARPETGVLLKDGHLFVAARWLAALCGASVRWDAEHQRVLLAAPGLPS